MNQNSDTAEPRTASLPFDIDIIITDAEWSDLIPDYQALCYNAVRAAWAVCETPKRGELSVALMSDADIQVLNRDYRGKDKPTNVLSFPSIGPVPLLGDIALARETLTHEAKDKGVSVAHHYSHLVIHGFLHLQGYDHEVDVAAEHMESLEIRALRALGIDNPYKTQVL